LDADLTERTTVSLGWDYQQNNTANPTWGGLPSLFSDGTRTHKFPHKGVYGARENLVKPGLPPYQTKYAIFTDVT
jgi:outer membrane receptor for ferric coprogen and ferric-rhodotorulic acid